MRNPFRKRRPICTTAEAAMLRRLILLTRVSAARAVISSRSVGIDDLLIIDFANQSLEQMRNEQHDPKTLRGGELFAKEIKRLVHANPSEGKPL